MCETNTSVYEYSKASDFIRDVFNKKKQKNSNFSYRSWAKQAGLSNHSMLAHIISGNRTIKSDLADKLKKTLKLSENESKFFDSLVCLENAVTEKEKKLILDEMEFYKDKNFTKQINDEQLNTMNHWYYFAIIEMTNLEDFKTDAEWIHSRLKYKVDVSEIEKVIKYLLDSEIIFVDENLKCKKSAKNFVSSNGVKNLNLQNLHRQFMNIAAESMSDTDVTKRNCSARTLSIPVSAINEANTLIEEFKLKMSLLSSSKAEETYQLNIQFYPLTEKGSV